MQFLTIKNNIGRMCCVDSGWFSTILSIDLTILTMFLRRLGNKSKIAFQVQEHFPSHKQYIEPFFGAGGMFFNKVKSKYNIVNDQDSDVYNLFKVLMDKQDELIDAFMLMPVHLDLWNYWKENKETDPIRKAIRFLFLSNYGFLGKAHTLRWGNKNTSQLILMDIIDAAHFMFGVEFMNYDFREMFRRISFKGDRDKAMTFIYADPPYLGTENNY